jgi:hypothetical protein
MNFADAMKQSNLDCFVEAMEKEVVDKVSRNHWKIYSRHQMRQTGYSGKVIMAVWSFKRKRNPFGVITRYKARLCAHGGQTVQGVHYDASYSPVVSWTTIRLLLTLTLVMGWFTRQIDFVLTFPQADTQTNVFMEVPGHFEVQNGKLARHSRAPNPRHQPNVLKLRKNLYGLKDAGLTWFKHLKDGLVKRGFRQSLVEPCMFIRGNLILLVYVDDCIAICPNNEPITKFIASMQTDYVLTDKGNIFAYLGIQVDRKKTNNGLEFHLTQLALIDQIIRTIPLKDQRLHDTPADRILYKGGEPRKTDFHYQSAVGQLNYLTASTRKELMVAVHQCARLSADPGLQHEQAIKRIVCYLKRTPDKGLILRPDVSRGLECHVDADFAGGFSPEYSDDATACYSWTGFIIWFAGCPLISTSKLQTTIALSTT